MSRETLQGSKVEPLARSMYPTERRTEGNHVESSELFFEKTAFQAGVDCLHLRLPAEEFPVGGDTGPENRRIRIRLPAGILGMVLDNGTTGSEAVCNSFGDFLSGGGNRTTLGSHDHNLTISGHLHGCEVGRSLHKTFDVPAHCNHAMRAGGHSLQEGRCYLGADCRGL